MRGGLFCGVLVGGGRGEGGGRYSSITSSFWERRADTTVSRALAQAGDGGTTPYLLVAVYVGCKRRTVVSQNTPFDLPPLHFRLDVLPRHRVHRVIVLPGLHVHHRLHKVR